MSNSHPTRGANPGAPPTRRELRRIVAAGSIGMFVEFYDYGVYGFFAGIIATAYFPPSAGPAALIMTWGLFAITFLIAPLGGVMIGSISDRLGRKTALVLSLTMMSGATTMIGLIPSYATIGIAAPLLLLLMRLIQGFSAGGEVAAAMSFIGENTPADKRAFMVSWGQVGSFASLLVGTSLGAFLSQALSSEALSSWGWRIPFLIAAPIGLVGYYIRRRLEDTTVFVEAKAKNEIVASPLRAALTDPLVLRRMGLVLGLALLNSSGYYIVFNYMPSYLADGLGFTMLDSLLVTSVSLVAIIVVIPPIAALADRIGRKPVMLGSSVGMALVVLPSYSLMNQGLALATLGAVIMACFFAGTTGVVHCVLVELFPTRVRGTAYSLSYQLSTAIFGGAAPLLITSVIAATGSPAIPAYYVVLTAIVTAFFVLRLRESAGIELNSVGKVERLEN